MEPSLGKRFAEAYYPYTTHFLRIRREQMFSRLVPGRYSQTPLAGPITPSWLRRIWDGIFGRKA
jgi:hypothetical protein